MSKKLTLEEFIKKSNLIHNNKYDYSLVKYKNNRTKVKIICPIHGEFEQIPLEHLNGTNCSKCTNNYNYTTEEFIEKLNKKHNNRYDYSLVNYINNKTNIKIICKEHGIFEQSPKRHLNGSNCTICTNMKKYTNETFIKKVNIVHNNKYDYSLVDYKNNKTKIKIICPIHGEFEQIPKEHLNGHGCNRCAGLNKKTNDEFITQANIIHNNKYDYSLINYINDRNKITIICPIHGEFNQLPSNHITRKQGCPKCKESKGEKEIRKILDLKNIKYESQKRFKDCKLKRPLPFDFYLPSINTCIEFDGHQHFIPNEIWGGENNLLEIKKRDEIKTNYCEKNNIKLIRIKYDNKLIEKTISELL